MVDELAWSKDADPSTASASSGDDSWPPFSASFW